MKSSVETLEGNKVKVYVEVDESEFETDIDQAFRTIAREVNLPGFRKGKVPRKVIEAQFGKGAAREQALRDSIPTYLTKAVAEHDVDIIATPEIEITGGEEDGDVEFEAEIEVRPTVEIAGYADLTIEVPAIEPSQELIDERQREQLASDGTLVDTGTAAATGDFLTLDLVTVRGDDDVPGLNTEDWSYELGQGLVADGFDDQLDGVNVGDVVKFTATPKGTEEPADFTVTVKAIQTLQLPELTDDWVADNIGEYDTVDGWTSSIRDELSEDLTMNARRVVGMRISEAIGELVAIELPEALVQSEMQQQLQAFARQLQQQGIDINQFIQMTGQDPNQFLESTREPATQAVKADLALRAIAADQQIEATDADLEMQFAQMAMQFGQKASDIRKVYQDNSALPELRADIRKQKAMDWLAHHLDFADPDGNPIDRDILLGHTDDDRDEPAAEQAPVVPEYEIVLPEDNDDSYGDTDDTDDESDES